MVELNANIIMVNTEAERLQCNYEFRPRHRKGLRVWVKDTLQLYMLDNDFMWQNLSMPLSTSFISTSKWQDF